jgi:hypothetical protein
MDRTLVSGPTGARGSNDEAYCPSCERSFPIDYNVCPDDGTRLAKLVARSDDLIGRVLDGRYEVRAALGAGGMGTVYAPASSRSGRPHRSTSATSTRRR